MNLLSSGAAAPVERLEDVREVAGLDAAAAVAHVDHAPRAAARMARRRTVTPIHRPSGACFRALATRLWSARRRAGLVTAGTGGAAAAAASASTSTANPRPRCTSGWHAATTSSTSAATSTARSVAHARLPPLETGVVEHLLDHVGQPPAFVVDQLAVAARLGGVGHHAGREVLRRGPDDGERRAQFVRHGGHEVHLARGQLLAIAAR